ncbi:AraC family transcriptional regulator [Sphingopyxis sp.]|uniref:AraC family transcriptional regulator n=1 Tax=Sphingopyxis sp. TaxID=1908224 RepID=UPI0026386191|nr:AraC family transcriptional regulator [Sphingopyxis sp.]MCW0197768.1 AraC family transcriptional regulator [Sphingopyxis sp.]
MLQRRPDLPDPAPPFPRGEGRCGEGRILFTLSGIVVVSVDNGSWVLPPQRALWVPRGVDYSSFARKSGALRSFALAGTETMAVPGAVRLLNLSPFFRELLIEASRDEDSAGQSVRSACLKSLILSEFEGNLHPASRMVAPRDSRLLNICQAILADPSDNRTIDDWARTVGMSRRALTRNFRQQTGLSLAVWRQQARLEEATARLRMGESVTRVAYEVGYESIATFSMIFRQNFGMSPSRYARSDAVAGVRG